MLENIKRRENIAAMAAKALFEILIILKILQCIGDMMSRN